MGDSSGELAEDGEQAGAQQHGGVAKPPLHGAASSIPAHGSARVVNKNSTSKLRTAWKARRMARRSSTAAAAAPMVDSRLATAQPAYMCRAGEGR